SIFFFICAVLLLLYLCSLHDALPICFREVGVASLGGPDLHVCLWTRGRDPDLGQCHAAVEGGQQSDSGFQTGKLLLVQIRLPTGVGVAVDSPTRSEERRVGKEGR